MLLTHNDVTPLQGKPWYCLELTSFDRAEPTGNPELLFVAFVLSGLAQPQNKGQIELGIVPGDLVTRM